MLTMRMTRTVILVSVCTSSAVAQARVSAPSADSSVASIMARIARHPGAPWQQDILRQVGSAYPQATLDAIADSLVATAIDPAKVDARGKAHASAVNSVNGLAFAGSREGTGKGIPYTGMLDRMITVHRRAPAPFVRFLALDHMLISPAHARAVDYVRQVAESSDGTASYAMEALIHNANGGNLMAVPVSAASRREAVLALQALARRGRVTDSKASAYLGSWISVYERDHPDRRR
jgi:hypothetical protein